MKLSNVAALYAMRLRAQLGQELLALIGIAVGVALLFAALVANTSLTGSFDRLTQGVVGDARLQVTARGQTIDEGLLQEVRRLPGVRAAAGFLEVRAEARGSLHRRSIVLIGADPGFADLNGALTRPFSYAFLTGVRAVALPTPLADDLGLALGQSVELAVRGRLATAPMGAKLQRSDIGTLVGSPFIVGPLRFVQQMSGLPGGVSRIMVVPDSGREADVRRALTSLAGKHANVTPASFEANLFRQAATPTNQSTMLFSLFSALVGFLFAFSAVLLTVPQRRQMVADLHTEGYGRATALKVLLFDALVLGFVASAIGLFVGIQVSHRLFGEGPGFLGYAFAFGSGQVVTMQSVVVAGVSGVVASCVAVLAPTAGMLAGSSDAGTTGVRGTLMPFASRWAPALIGTACCAAGLTTVIRSPSTTAAGVAGLALLTAGMLLVLPAFQRLMVHTLDGVTASARSIVPFLAISDLRDPRTRGRSIAVAATGAVAIFATVALQGAHADLQRGLDRTSHDLAADAPLWVVPPGDANLLATTPFRIPALRSLRGIASLMPYRSSFLDIGNRRVWVLGPPATSTLPLPQNQTIGVSTRLATSRLRSGGWAVVSAAIADERGLRVGKTFLLPAPVPLTLRVAALSTNLGWPPGAIVINANDYARAWGRQDVSALLATPAPTVSVERARADLRAALGRGTGLVVETSAERERKQREASRSGLARLTQIASLVLVSAMIAMAAAMAGMIWQRRRFFAAMKVEGYGTADLWLSLFVEATALIGAGCLFGAAFGLLGQRLLSQTLSNVTGFPIAYSLAGAGAFGICALLTLVTVGIIVMFGLRAAQVSPANRMVG